MKVYLVYQMQTKFARAEGTEFCHDPEGAFYEEETLIAVVRCLQTKAQREKIAKKYPDSKIKITSVIDL